MFGKKCPKCNNKINGSFKYCPLCGIDLNAIYEHEDYGFLGKSDLIEEDYTDAFIDKMFNSAMKLFEKQIKNLNSELNKSHPHNVPGLNVQFFINGERVFPEKSIKQQKIEIPKEKLKKFAELPKEEAKSKIKRLSGKLIYELIVPGVKSVNDVLINKLENSIEVKALSKDKVYSKNLKVNLPISSCYLADDVLVIEMVAR